MSGKSKLAVSIAGLLHSLPTDHVAQVGYSRDPHGREVLMVEGMTVTILHKHDPLSKPDHTSRHFDPYSQRQVILSSSAKDFGDFRVYLTMPPAIVEQEELLVRGYFAKHLRLSRGIVLEVG